jgi:uncharacterized membrane protein
MTGDNLVLCVASYSEASAARKGLEALKGAEESGDFKVVGSVVIDRDAEGKVHVKESGHAEVGGGVGLGAIGGLVVGLFAPPLLLSTALGAGIGASIGALVKRHEEKELGVDLEQYLPANSSAVVAVVDDRYLDRVDRALADATAKVNKAIDSGDYEKLEKALSDAADKVASAAES